MGTLDSKAVAEMLGKRHDNFMRELRKYVDTLGEAAPQYFRESTKGRGAGYEITLKGCELIAGRLIGAKSTEFREKYKALLPDEPEEAKGYSTEEVAKKLGCSRRTVQRMIQRGELSTTQVTIMVPSVRTVITPEELERYQNERAAV